MRILKINSLPSDKTWVDADNVMLHACFQILEDCVEQEHVDTHCNYKEHKAFVDEVRFLYRWWMERKKQQRKLEQDKVDDAMLLRLMVIRRSLWT